MNIINREALDMDRVLAAAEDSMFGMGNIGFCVRCGHEQDGCEPDARRYECEECGERAVFGASEIVLMVAP